MVTGIPRLHCGRLVWWIGRFHTPVARSERDPPPPPLPPSLLASSFADMYAVLCAPCVFLGGLREYKHVGIGVYLSRKGQGDVLLSPSGAERLVYLWWSRSVVGHYLTSYMNGLLAVAAHVPDLRGDTAARTADADILRVTAGERGWASGLLDPLDGDFKSMA